MNTSCWLTATAGHAVPEHAFAQLPGRKEVSRRRTHRPALLYRFPPRRHAPLRAPLRLHSKAVPAASCRGTKARVVRVSAGDVEKLTKATRNPAFPFTKIVGQDEMKLALLLNVIDRNIGGVLIMGDRGTAKSVCVR